MRMKKRKLIALKFDDIPIKTGDVLTELPISYKGITWSPYAYIYTKDTINTIFNATRMQSGVTNPPSGKNFLYGSGGFEWAAATQEERFGVEELSLLCEFPPWQDPDYAKQNGRPCSMGFHFFSYRNFLTVFSYYVRRSSRQV